MSLKNFTIPTKTVYNLIHVIWFFAVIGFVLKIMITVAQPTDVRLPIYFSIEDAGHLVDAEDKKVSIIGQGTIRHHEDYQPPMITIIISHLKSFSKGALVLFILFQIKTIVAAALEENPLNYQNSDRLLKIGWAILAIGIINVFSPFMAEYSMGINFNENIDCNCDEARRTGMKVGAFVANLLSETNILIGMLTIALSSVFKTGASMKKEADLTI